MSFTKPLKASISCQSALDPEFLKEHYCYYPFCERWLSEGRKEAATQDKGINTPLTFSIQAPFEVPQLVAVVMLRVRPSFLDASVSVSWANANKHVIPWAPNWYIWCCLNTFCSLCSPAAFVSNRWSKGSSRRVPPLGTNQTRPCRHQALHVRLVAASVRPTPDCRLTCCLLIRFW